MSHNLEFRTQLLKDFGASGSALDELLAYNRNVFDHSVCHALPCEDEPFVPCWQAYAAEAKKIGTFDALRKRLVQLHFPIQQGISDTQIYRNAVRKGRIPDSVLQGEGLKLKAPDTLELFVHQTLAGRIPVIVAGEKEDFVTLLQALTFKNEPQKVPASQGAAMIAGYNNWDRIWQLQARVRQEKAGLYSEAIWAKEFRKILPQKQLYQDKFMLLSRDYYSGVPPEVVGLSDQEWRNTSLIIRREHECTHYFTKRVLASMQNKALDELIADYAGITAAIGTFRADWFLAFVGLENYPAYREGGRLQNYRGEPALSDRAFSILQKLLYRAVQNLEHFRQHSQHALHDKAKRGALLRALTHLTLEELSSAQAHDLIKKHLLERKEP